MVGFIYILIFWLLGEAVSLLIHGYIPGCVIGMVLLFLSLKFKVVLESKIEKSANFLLKNMALFFVPPATGILVVYPHVKESIIPIFIVSLLSTIIVIATVGLTVQFVRKKKHHV